MIWWRLVIKLNGTVVVIKIISLLPFLMIQVQCDDPKASRISRRSKEFHREQSRASLPLYWKATLTGLSRGCAENDAALVHEVSPKSSWSGHGQMRKGSSPGAFPPWTPSTFLSLEVHQQMHPSYLWEQEVRSYDVYKGQCCNSWLLSTRI